MTKLKYSRQRESIKEFLAGRHDHPTADAIYMNIREQYPNISLGTVYRNLSLLSELGEILKIDNGSGEAHFDYNTEPHTHFVCSHCHSVIDMDVPQDNAAIAAAQEHFPGRIDGQVIYFTGVCDDCLKKS